MSGRRRAEEGTRKEEECLGGMSQEFLLMVGFGQRLPGSEKPLEQDLPAATFLVCRQENARVTQKQEDGYMAGAG